MPEFGLQGSAGLQGSGGGMANSKEMSIYDQHLQAAQEWHEACHDFRRAEERKANAAKRLQEVTQRMSDVLQQVTVDPTQLQPTAATNGQIGYPRY